MKKYKLKQWYPSLDKQWDTTHRYEYQSSTGYMCNKSIQHCVILYKKELHPDFWEEKKEPLFVTEDGVDVVNGMRIHSVRKSNFDRNSYIVDENFVKEQTSKHPYVYFFHEANADEYIWKNKPLFSYEDFIRWGNVPYERVIEQLAKERIKK